MLNHRRSAQECGSVRQKSSVPAAAIGKGCPLRSSFLSRPGAKVGGGVVNRLPGLLCSPQKMGRRTFYMTKLDESTGARAC